MQLSQDCYRISSRFPQGELHGLTSQLRRAAVSVPANIAEGNGRFTRPDYIRHLSIANGSLREVETLLHLAYELGWIGRGDLDPALAATEATGRMLVGLIKRLRA
jgi:four helix bundle protein